MSLDKIKHNILSIKQTLSTLSSISTNCTLLCVTKYASTQQILNLYEAGERHFGENKVQDTEKKQSIINQSDIKWHFIGHLQRNKVKKAIQLYDCIQSVDSLKLLKKINQESENIGKTQDIYIQINLTNEKQKFGFTYDEFTQNAEEFFTFKSCNIKGIMSMGPHTSDENHIRDVFKQSNECRTYLSTFTKQALQLSMGMSSDYEIAVEEGSDMVRIGSKLFD